DARARDEVGDRARHEHFAALRPRANTRADVYTDAAVVVAPHLDFAGVHTDAHLEAELANRVSDWARTPEGARRTVECREEAGARCVDLAAAEASQLAPDHGVVAVEERPPAPVTELDGAVRRADDVGEQNSRKYAVGLDFGRRSGQKRLHLGEQLVVIAGVE